MKRILPLLVLLFFASGAIGQGFPVLSYRMGSHLDAGSRVGLTEYRLQLPGFQMRWGERAQLNTAFGYHHADFGSDLRFWGSNPMDAWLAGANLGIFLNDRNSIALGSAVRLSRLGEGNASTPAVFHQSGASFQHAFGNHSEWSVGFAYRNGVALPLIPILGYKGRIGPSITAEVLLPGRMYFWKMLSADRSLGLFARYQTTPYPSPAVSSVKDGVLRHRMVRAGVAYEQAVAPRWVVRGEFSGTLVHDRKLVIDRTTTDLDTAPTLVLDVSLIYVLPGR